MLLSPMFSCLFYFSFFPLLLLWDRRHLFFDGLGMKKACNSNVANH